MGRMYQVPEFLEGLIAQEAYERWLGRKAQSHVNRDRARGNGEATRKAYKMAIHRAVQESNGVDAYTGEKLEWKLLSTYRNEESKRDGRKYKNGFALLPSVDHVGDGTGPADFKICAWRTNDSKNDLSLSEFQLLCKRVLEHAGLIARTDG